MFSLVRVLPSTDSAAPANVFQSFVRPLHRYLRRDPTPRRRSCRTCGLSLLRPDCSVSVQSVMRSPGSRACSFSACLGSATTWDLRRTRVGARRSAAFPFCPQGRHPRLGFRSSIPSPLMPRAYASTAASRPPPQDWRSGGSLLLSCRTLSFPTTCRLIPAHGQAPISP